VTSSIVIPTLLDLPKVTLWGDPFFYIGTEGLIFDAAPLAPNPITPHDQKHELY